MKHLTLKLFPFVVGLVILTIGCDDTREYYLTEEMRNTIPFTGREKVSFLSEGDTVVLISEFRINAQYKTSYGKNNQHYCYVEINEIYFFGEDHTFIYTISNGPDFQHPNQLHIDCNNNHSYESSGTAYIRLPLSKNNLSSNQSYFDQLELLGKTYQDVYCCSNVKSWETSEYRPIYIYYTKEFGIIRIDFADGTKWELIGIEWYNLSS